MPKTARRLFRSFRFLALLLLLFAAPSVLVHPGFAESVGTGGSAAESAAAVNETNINSLWVLIAAAMVFLMQPGFLCFEVGCVRPNSIVSVAMKNLVDWVMVAALFFLVGFGLMFGTSWGGVIGTDFFLLQGIGVAGGTISPFVFFLFQLAFAATAATIVSGAMSERTGFVTYLMASGIVGLFIYPVFGHWGWGNLLLENNETWLTRLGFMDFAGSTVVHSVGGWVALVGVWFLGARLGRYDSEGNLKPVEALSFPIASLGLFILWFGWWGFNGGSTLAMNGEVGCIIVNTVIAAAAAGMGAFIHSWFVQQKADIHEKFMGGDSGRTCGDHGVLQRCHSYLGLLCRLVGSGGPQPRIRFHREEVQAGRPGRGHSRPSDLRHLGDALRGSCGSGRTSGASSPRTDRRAAGGHFRVYALDGRGLDHYV